VVESPGEHQANSLGCLALGLLFGGVAAAGALFALFSYILFVEQWGLISVRREFSYDMALLWAPLSGLIAGCVALLWATRSRANRQRTGVITGIAMLVAMALLLLVFGLGMVI
jgi:hypothetical protein